MNHIDYKNKLIKYNSKCSNIVNEMMQMENQSGGFKNGFAIIITSKTFMDKLDATKSKELISLGAKLSSIKWQELMNWNATREILYEIPSFSIIENMLNDNAYMIYLDSPILDLILKNKTSSLKTKQKNFNNASITENFIRNVECKISRGLVIEQCIEYTDFIKDIELAIIENRYSNLFKQIDHLKNYNTSMKLLYDFVRRELHDDDICFALVHFIPLVKNRYFGYKEYKLLNEQLEPINTIVKKYFSDNLVIDVTWGNIKMPERLILKLPNKFTNDGAIFPKLPIANSIDLNVDDNLKTYIIHYFKNKKYSAEKPIVYPVPGDNMTITKFKFPDANKSFNFYY
jgi:hypothetical protein